MLWGIGAFSFGVQWPGREVDNSVECSIEVKNEWSYGVHGMCKNNFTTIQLLTVVRSKLFFTL